MLYNSDEIVAKVLETASSTIPSKGNIPSTLRILTPKASFGVSWRPCLFSGAFPTKILSALMWPKKKHDGTFLWTKGSHDRLGFLDCFLGHFGYQIIHCLLFVLPPSAPTPFKKTLYLTHSQGPRADNATRPPFPPKTVHDGETVPRSQGVWKTKQTGGLNWNINH